MTEPTPFNPIRAIVEEIDGLNGLASAVMREEQRARETMVEAEERYNRLAKIREFVRGELDRKRGVLTRLREIENAKSQ
jgi:hypothetical protein